MIWDADEQALGLYMAAGIPVIVKKGLSCEKYVTDNEIGAAATDFEDVYRIAVSESEDKLSQYYANVKKLQNLFINGIYTRKLLLDTFHMNIEEASVCGAICRAGSLVRHVHFVDNTRAVPGMGCMALPDVVACLKAVGYEGFLGIEAIPGSDPEGEARSGLAFTRALGV